MKTARQFDLPWARTDVAPAPDVRTILVVCTANEARSPLIQRVLAAEFDHHAPGRFSVISGGTRVSRPGSPMAPVARSVLRANGFTESPFASQALSANMIADADLIIAAETSHMDAILDLAPSAMKRTFTLLQLAEMAAAYLVGGVDVPFIEMAPVLRGTVRANHSGEFDLEDPVGYSAAQVRALGDRVNASVQLIVEVLAK